MLNKIKKELREYATDERKKTNMWFFKTGEGQYGEGDKFLGVTLPEIRSVAKKYEDVAFDVVQGLVSSEFHEERMLGLIILTYQYNKSKSEEEKKKIFDFYVKNIRHINNWDLVDVTCHRVVGDYLKDKNRKFLYDLAKSNDLWEKRIGIISTFAFFKDNDFKDSLAIADILLNDEHDLIHKAVGWTLREVGKRDIKLLRDFLTKYSKTMPRTALRYSIEKFPEDERKKWLGK